ncbi:MAG: shikimate dehydrogenase family protein [Thermoleophilaceae bacterium]
MAHSRSPVMHNAALAELGLDWLYARLPLRPERFEQTVRALPASGFRGLNVTVPHKLAAHGLADGHTAAAAAIGAANTLTFVDGRIEADNTDAGGFLDALGISPRGLRVLVLGAGGSARAVVWALREAGAAEVSIWNRTAGRAGGLARQMNVRHAEHPEAADVLVNCTSVGLDPKTTVPEALRALELAGHDPPATVVDLVYGAGPTPLTQWARGAGARVVEGLEVLASQGARSLEGWTGRPSPIDLMRRAAQDR